MNVGNRCSSAAHWSASPTKAASSSRAKPSSGSLSTTCPFPCQPRPGTSSIVVVIRGSRWEEGAMDGVDVMERSGGERLDVDGPPAQRFDEQQQVSDLQ